MAETPHDPEQRWPAGPSAAFHERRLLVALAGACLVLVVLLAYLPALRGGFIWDDDAWTGKLLPVLRATSGLRAIWFEPKTLQQYYPLSGTTFWLDYQLWEFRPLPYHLENVLLHAVAALLFWRSLRGLRVPGAALAGAIFALHPLMVESAAWIAERKNVLSLCLCLASFLALMRYRGEAVPLAARGPSASSAHGLRAAHRKALDYLLALLLFVAAMFAKTSVCTMPAAALLLIWFRAGALRWREDVLPTIPFFSVALVLGAVTAWLEKMHVGAQGVEYALTFSQRGLIAGHAFWFYLGKLLWPAHLCFVYPRRRPEAAAVGQWLYPIAALGLLFMLWRKRALLGRGPVTALLFFAGTLAPLLGFANVYFMRYSFVCDHWTYLPSLGPIALLSAGLSKLTERRRPKPWAKLALGAVLLFTLTTRRAAMYANLEMLWRTTIDDDPSSWVASNNLGNALFRSGNVAEAVSCFMRAIESKPDLAEAYTSLGVAFGSEGLIEEAIAKFTDAIRVAPDYAEAYYDLGIALDRAGRTDESIGQFEQAIRLKPGFSAAKARLRVALARKRCEGLTK